MCIWILNRLGITDLFLIGLACGAAFGDDCRFDGGSAMELPQQGRSQMEFGNEEFVILSEVEGSVLFSDKGRRN